MVKKVASLGVRYAMVIAFPLLQSQRLESVIQFDAFHTKDIVSRSHSDTSPIYFFDRGKPFFECVRIHNLLLAGSVVVLMSCVQIYELLFALD